MWTFGDLYGDRKMDVKYDLIELPEEFPFELTDMNLPPFYSMGSEYHWHDCFELSYAKSGSGSYDIEDRHYTFNQGELMIINNVEPHRMQVGDRGMNQLVLVFNPQLILMGSNNLLDYEYMKAFVDRGRRVQQQNLKQHPYFADINSLILDIEKEFKERHTGWQLMIKPNCCLF